MASTRTPVPNEGRIFNHRCTPIRCITGVYRRPAFLAVQVLSGRRGFILALVAFIVFCVASGSIYADSKKAINRTQSYTVFPQSFAEKEKLLNSIQRFVLARFRWRKGHIHGMGSGSTPRDSVRTQSLRVRLITTFTAPRRRNGNRERRKRLHFLGRKVEGTRFRGAAPDRSVSSIRARWLVAAYHGLPR